VKEPQREEFVVVESSSCCLGSEEPVWSKGGVILVNPITYCEPEVVSRNHNVAEKNVQEVFLQITWRCYREMK
jgi:hypothetical protein